MVKLIAYILLILLLAGSAIGSLAWVSFEAWLLNALGVIAFLMGQVRHQCIE